jgi:hypothetical protein
MQKIGLSCVKNVLSVIFQDQVGMRGVIALSCAVLTIPVFGLLAFSQVHPLVSTLWLGITYSFAAVSTITL